MTHAVGMSTLLLAACHSPNGRGIAARRRRGGESAMTLKTIAYQISRRVREDVYSKDWFLRDCPHGARLLDVGCGNNSPRSCKAVRPDIYYVGIDIGDYNQSDEPALFADQYIIESPNSFSQRIDTMAAQFDAVISAHNIEHCDDPTRTLSAMLGALRARGRLFMSFPCEASVRFPHRDGSLNFHDDATHKVVPKFNELVSAISAGGYRIDVAIRRHRPLAGAIRGLLNEPRSRREKRILPGTWALYGFESIIWASRPDEPAGHFT